MKIILKFLALTLVLLSFDNANAQRMEHIVGTGVYASKCGWQEKFAIKREAGMKATFSVRRGNWKSNGETYTQSGKNHKDSRSLLPNVNVMAVVLKITDGNNVYYMDFANSTKISYRFESDDGYFQFGVNDGDCSDNEGDVWVDISYTD